jgi:hypothetical protein
VQANFAQTLATLGTSPTVSPTDVLPETFQQVSLSTREKAGSLTKSQKTQLYNSGNIKLAEAPTRVFTASYGDGSGVDNTNNEKSSHGMPMRIRQRSISGGLELDERSRIE